MGPQNAMLQWHLSRTFYKIIPNSQKYLMIIHTSNPMWLLCDFAMLVSILITVTSFSFGGQSRKSFCIFLFVICRQKGALKKIFSLAADFHLWKRLSPNLTLLVTKVVYTLCKTNLKLVELSFFGRSSDMWMCMNLFFFINLQFSGWFCKFSVYLLCETERERERDLLIATLDPDKMSNILHRANTQTIYFDSWPWTSGF